jgi:hypothetical protein
MPRHGMVAPDVKRDAVAKLVETFQVSPFHYAQDRACKVAVAHRSVARHVSRRPDDARIRERLKVLANERRRGACPRESGGVSETWHIAATRRHLREPQKDLPALHSCGLEGAPSLWPQTGTWCTFGNDFTYPRQSDIGFGFCV